MCVILVTSGQRAPFAGSRPNGYKDKLQSNNANTNVNNNGIADRFGENTSTGVIGTTGTTEKLPHLALGDREIVDRLNSDFPVDQRPFWLINAEAIEAQKNQGRPSNPTNQNVANGNPTNAAGGIVNRFGSASSGTTNSNNGNRPNYPSVVYPIEMTAVQQQQAQQMFHNQIQQTLANNNKPMNANPLTSRIGVQQAPVVNTQQTINNGPKQSPQPVQGRLTNSGYNG